MTYTTRKGTYLSLDVPCGKNKLEQALDWLSEAFQFRSIEPALRVNDISDEFGKYQYMTIELDMPDWDEKQVSELVRYYKNRFLNIW